MGNIFRLLTIPFAAMFAGTTRPAIRPPDLQHDSISGFYSFVLPDIHGDLLHFSKFRGKKVLIVNTASECGYTPQYKDLQKLQEEFNDRLVILGFPCNDFGGQEPGTASDIIRFCEDHYQITFPLFEKVHVTGKDVCPLFKWLTDKKLNGWNSQAPSWNFCKYIIDENGNLMAFFPSSVKPFDEKILSLIR